MYGFLVTHFLYANRKDKLRYLFTCLPRVVSTRKLERISWEMRNVSDFSRCAVWYKIASTCSIDAIEWKFPIPISSRIILGLDRHFRRISRRSYIPAKYSPLNFISTRCSLNGAEVLSMNSRPVSAPAARVRSGECILRERRGKGGGVSLYGNIDSREKFFERADGQRTRVILMAFSRVSFWQGIGGIERPIVSVETARVVPAPRITMFACRGKSRWTHATACLHSDDAIGLRAL